MEVDWGATAANTKPSSDNREEPVLDEAIVSKYVEAMTEWRVYGDETYASLMTSNLCW
jgi:hypothetical protein